MPRFLVGWGQTNETAGLDNRSQDTQNGMVKR